MKPPKSPRIKSAFIRIILISSMILMLACHRKEQESKVSMNADPLMDGRQVVFIIPEGFSGVLKIVKNSDHSVETRGDDNRIDIHFSSDGVYTVKNFRVLEEPHTLSAQFSSGEVLRVEPEEDLRSEEKALWTVGTFRGTKYPLETMIYLVCTKEEKAGLAAGLR